MQKNPFLAELEFRGMLQDHSPGVEEYLQPGAVGYIGFDPTSDSLTIGNLVQIMILTLFQRHGYRPIVLMGGATGRIGDPSGKDKERELKSVEEIEVNVSRQIQIIKKLLDFDHEKNGTLLINNLDYYQDMNVLDFLRHVGKTLTVNYMMSKESVKKRIETGMSFTEFSYQLLQGYDFKMLYEKQGCALQMGGSDQWGNITAGTEFIRRHSGGKAYGITTPLLTKSDGSKMGKSETGAIWLSADKTSPYQFYQYWLNSADADCERIIRYFSLKTHEEILALCDLITKDPKAAKESIASELTSRIHGVESLRSAQHVSQMLFSNQLNENMLRDMSADAFAMMEKEIPTMTISTDLVHSPTNMESLLTQTDLIFSSKGELRRAIKGNALSINKNKVLDPTGDIKKGDFIHDRYLLIENGKKNKYLLILDHHH